MSVEELNVPLLKEASKRDDSERESLHHADDAYLSPVEEATLMVRFPHEVDTGEKKIVYSLWRKGPQCYCELRLTTALSKEDMSKTIPKLLEEGRIKVRKIRKPDWLRDLGDDDGEFDALSYYYLPET